MTQGDLNNCNEPGPIKNYNFDEAPPYCREDQADCDNNPYSSSLKDVPGRVGAWIDEPTLQVTGIGQRADCDPFLKGHIINSQAGSSENRNVVYRYAKSLRGTDEAVKSLFNDIVVLDTSSKAHLVPIIWGTQEKAVIVMLGENYRKDSTMVVDRIKLPIMSIASTSYDIDMKRYTYHKAEDYLRTHANDWKPGFAVKEQYERDTVFGVSRGLPINIGYTLYAWTLYEEDMNHILEQIYPKLLPMGYIRVKGIGWEIPVRLDSVSNNIDYEPGDQKLRVIKFQFNLTAETYLAQPIHRKKAVLKTRTEFVDTVDEDNVTEVITRLEKAVEGYND